MSHERNLKYLNDHRIIYRQQPINDIPDQENEVYMFYLNGTHECYELFRSSAKITTYKSLKWHLLVLWYLNPQLDQDDFMKLAEIIDPDKPFKVCYQSTFGPEKWIQPNIVDVLEDLAEKGIKKVSVACPSFTADCLETLEEIAVENHEDFENNGGEYVKLIPSLNDNDDWVKGFANYLHDKELEASSK